VSHSQKRSPGARFVIHAASPQTHPMAKIATTANPTSLWTSGTGGVYVPAGPS
jgi:hypothetical protein